MSDYQAAFAKIKELTEELASRDAEIAMLREQVKMLRDAINGALWWDRNRDYIVPYIVRDPMNAAIDATGSI